MAGGWSTQEELDEQREAKRQGRETTIPAPVIPFDFPQRAPQLEVSPETSDWEGVDEDQKEATNTFGALLKQRYGLNPVITSGRRSPEMNAQVNGAANSWHIPGKATDMNLGISADDPRRGEIEQLARDHGFGEVLYHDAGSGLHLHVANYTGPIKAAANRAVKAAGEFLQNLGNRDAFKGLENNYDMMKTENPDNYAMDLSLSKLTGFPIDVIQADPQNRLDIQGIAQNKLNQGLYDWETIARDYPETTNFLQDPNAMAASHDDIHNMTTLEFTLDTIKRGWKSFDMQMELAKLAMAQKNGDTSVYTELAAQNLEKRMEEEQKRVEAEYGFLPTAVYNTSNFLSQQAFAFGKGLNRGAQGLAMGAMAGAALGGVGAVPGGIAGLRAGMMTGMAEATYYLEDSLAYREMKNMRDKFGTELDPKTMDFYSGVIGAVNAGLESLQLGILAKPFARGASSLLKSQTFRKAITDLAKGYGGAMIGESATEAMQRASNLIFYEMAKSDQNLHGGRFDGITWEQAGKELKDEFTGALEMFWLPLLPGHGMKFARDYRAAKTAAVTEQTYLALGDGLKNTKLLDRLPDVAREFVARKTADGPLENIFVDAKQFATYFQDKGMDPSAVAKELGVESQLEAAVNSGGDLVVPTADFATKLAKTEHYNALSPDVKFKADEMTPRQAQEFIAQRQEALEEAKAKAQEYLEQVGRIDEGTQQVHNQVRAMALGAGRSEKEADAMAQVQAANARAMITNYGDFFAQQGIHTPYDFFQRFGIGGIEKGVAPTQLSAAQFSQYAGRNAATADKTLLEKAQELVAAGRNPEQVRQETGWNEGMDGKWRFEIDDSQAKMIDKSAWQKEIETKAKTLNKQLKKATGEERAALEAQRAELQAEVWKAHSASLESTLDHPALYKAYPDLRGVKVLFDDMEHSGQYMSDTDTITISNRLSNEEAKNTLLHEVQHAIQAREDFARGGNSGTIKVNSPHEFAKEVNRLKSKVDNENIGWTSTSSLTPENIETTAAHNLYKRLAGEIEARDTANRAGLSAEERRNVMPDLRDDAILFQEKQSVKDKAFSDMVKYLTGKDLESLDENDFSRIDDFCQKSYDNTSLKERFKDRLLLVREVLHNGGSKEIVRGIIGRRNDGSGVANDASAHRDGRTGTDQHAETEGTGNKSINDDRSGNNGQGDSFYQDGPRAAIQLTDGQSFVKLFETADNSSMFHETGHHYLAQLQRFAAMDEAPQQLKNDLQTIRDWVGWQEGQTDFSREQHEQFARGFEAYLMTGEAPTVGLRAAFARFKKWLVEIYRDAKNLNVQLPDEVRQVMDRLLSSHDEVLESEALNEYKAILGKDELTAKDLDVYQKMLDDAHDEAESRLIKSRLKELLAERSDEYQDMKRHVTAKVRDDLARDPVYMARAAMQAPAKKAELKAEIEARIDAIIDEQVQLLVKNSKQGVEKRVADTENDVYLAGFSRNQAWYRKMIEMLPGERLPAAWGDYIDWVKAGSQTEEGKKPRRMPPKMKEMFRGIAIDQLEKGWFEDEFGEIPASEEYLALKDRSQTWEILMDIGGGLKLNEEYMREEYPEFAKKIPQNMMIKDGQFMPEQIAEIFGFSSADHMLGEIAAARPLSEETKVRVDYEMKEHAKLKDKANALADAEEAVRNANRLEVLALENEILHDKMTKRSESQENMAQARTRAVEMAREVRRQARAVLEKQPVKDAGRFINHFANERRHAEAAAKALAKKDYALAAQEQNERMLAHAMAMESIKVKKLSDKYLAQMKRIGKKKMDSFGDQDSFEQVGSLLARFGISDRKDFIATIKAGKRMTLQGWEESMDKKFGSETGDGVTNIAPWLYDETFSKGWNVLNIVQLEGLKDAVVNITWAASKQDRFFLLSEKQKINDLALELGLGIEKHIKGDRSPGMEPGRFEDSKAWLEQYLYSLERFSTICQRADNWHDNGLWDRTLNGAVKRQADQESAKRREMLQGLKELWGLYSKKELKDIFDKKRAYDELNGLSITKQRLLAMALNMGNEDNRETLFDVRPVGISYNIDWNKDLVLKLMQNHLTEKDWRFVQGVWDLIDKLRPDMFAMHEQLTGFSPKRIEASPFTIQTADGKTVEVRGGYYPKKVDPRSSEKAAVREMSGADSLTEQNPTWKANTRQGASKQRTGAKYPLTLELSLITRHINEVVHDTYFRPLVYDLRRLLNHDGFRETTRAKLGPAGWEAIKSFVNAVANGGRSEQLATDAMSAAARAIGNRASMAIVAGRVSIIMQNFANWALVPQAVDGFGYADTLKAFLGRGAGYFAKSVAYWPAAKAMREDVYKLSSFMRDKAENPEYSLQDLKGSKITQKEGLGDFFLGLIAATDNMINIPVWMEAYNKKINEGATQQQAVQFADSLIDRITGSGRKYDVAKILRGSDMEKLLSKLYSFWSVEYNRWLRETGIIRRDGVKGVPRMLGFLAGRMVFIIASAYLAGNVPDDDADDDEKDGFWMKQFLTYPVSFYPGAREIVNVAMDKALGLPTYGYRPSPITSGIENAEKAWGLLVDYNNDKVDFDAVVEAGSRAAAFAKPYPDQFNIWFWNMYNYAFDDMDLEFKDLYKRRPRKER